MQYMAFLPELIVVGAAFVVLMFEAVAPRRASGSSFILAAFALLGAFLALWFTPAYSWGSVLRADAFSSLVKSFLVGGSLLILLYAWPYLRERVSGISEFCFLFLTSVFGLMLVTSATNFITFVVALETASLGMYTLAASMRRDRSSVEAGVKFFLNSAFATAIMLWGLSIIYGLTGSLDFSAVYSSFDHFAASSSMTPEIKPFHLLGILALIVGIGFKITLFPFHLWAPDVYQGSPTPFTAFLATISKAAGFAILIRVVVWPILPLVGDMQILFVALATLTMLAASTAALLQSDAKRLLAYSSISHAGFMLIAIATMRDVRHLSGPAAAEQAQAVASLLFYLVAYMSATIGAFVVLYTIESKRKDSSLKAFNGLWRTDPALTFSMTVFIASLAGLPPTIGFIGKFLIFYQAYSADMMFLLVAAVVATVISLFFYFKIIRCMILNTPDDEVSFRDSPTRAFAVILCGAILLAIFFSEPLRNACMEAGKAVLLR